MNLQVPKGSLFAILGGNGAGKSTLLKAVCGICPPYRGKLLLDGVPLKKWKGKELFRGNLALCPRTPKISL